MEMTAVKASGNPCVARTLRSAVESYDGAAAAEGVSKCDRAATLALRFHNNYSFRERATRPLFYCDEHAELVGWSASDRGLRVLVERIGPDGAAHIDDLRTR